MSPPGIQILARMVLAAFLLIAYAETGTETSTTLPDYWCAEDTYFNGTDCAPCAVGYRKDAGLGRACLPTLQAVIWERTTPDVSAVRLPANLLKVTVKMGSLPSAVYGVLSVRYRFDLQSKEADLHFNSSCSDSWTQTSQTEFFTTVSSSSGDCSFNETAIDGEFVQWSTLVAAFIVTNWQEASPPYIVPLDLLIEREVVAGVEGGGGWGIRTIYAGTQTINVDGPASTLKIFASPSYELPMKEAFFTEGDDIFVEHSLDNSGLGFGMELQLVWLSTSREPDYQVGLQHDLTAEVGPVVGVASVRFTFKARDCRPQCWLHCISRVAPARRLQQKPSSLAREADPGANDVVEDVFSGATVGVVIQRLTTPSPDVEDTAKPDLHEFRHPGVIIVAAVGVANAVAWPTLMCILHCRDATPLDLPPQEQRYRILSSHAHKILVLDLLRLVLTVTSFVLAVHFKELDATSDPDVMLRGLLVFTSLGGFLFLVEAIGWALQRRSDRRSGLQQPKSIVLLACFYLLVADVPTAAVYAGVAIFGWLDGSFPWVSTFGVTFAVLLLVVKLVAVNLAARAAQRAARTADC